MRAALLVAVLSTAAVVADDTRSPYSGQEQREIKSLSAAEVGQYLDGAGMGYAKAAELNHYPGPKHVLELADELALTEAQVAATTQVHDSMKSRAAGLGRRLVELEGQLDRQFAQQTIDEQKLGRLLAEISQLEGQIRHTHLAAHLQQKLILTDSQVKHYDHLRGYGAGRHQGHDH